MNANNVIAIKPVALVIEFDPDIRLGELLHSLGPDFIARATLNGRVRIEKSKAKHEGESNGSHG